MGTRAIARNVIQDAIRQKVVYVTLLFALLLFAVEPLLPSFEMGLRIQLFQDISLGVASLAIAVLAVVLSVNQVPAEVERHTIYNVLSKPVSRSAYLAGKYVGVLSVVASCAGIMALAVFAFDLFFFGETQPNVVVAFFAAFLEGAVISAFAVFISTFTSPSVNAFACLLFYFAGHAKNAIVDSITSNGAPLSTIAKGLGFLVPSLENFNLNEAVARGLSFKPLFIAELTLYAFTFSLLFIVIASILFSRKEI